MSDAKLTAEREAEIRAADAWHGEDIGRHGLGPPIHHRRELLAEIDRLRTAESAARADERAAVVAFLREDDADWGLLDAAEMIERGEHIAGKGGEHG